MNHVAWSCDGKKLAAVGIDKLTRVWHPDKSVSADPISFHLYHFYRWTHVLLLCFLAVIQTMSTMFRGIQRIPTYFAPQARKIGA